MSKFASCAEVCSPWPRTNRSMKSAIGSQQFDISPPAIIIGSDSFRWAVFSFRPARSRIFSTFV